MTRIPCCAHSTARERVRPTTPCLLAMYVAEIWLLGTTKASSEAVFTILPPPVFIISRAAAWQPKNTPLRLTLWRRSHCSGVRSRAAQRTVTPALLTIMSRRPLSATVWVTAFRIWSGSVTSTSRDRPTPPASSMRARVFEASSRRWGRSAMVTSAPDLASPHSYRRSNAPRTAGYYRNLSAQVYG